MKDDNKQPHSKSDIENENNFLKMKMMLERGAVMWSMPGLDPELENAFLNQVIRIEEQYDKDKKKKRKKP